MTRNLLKCGGWVMVVGVVGMAGAQAQTTIASDHVDIGIAYEGGAWDLHVHQEEPAPGAEYAPSEAVFVIGESARLAGGIPNTPVATSFFGAAGSPLWVLPKTQVEDLPFLGIGTEEMSASDWNGPLTLSLRSVSGPGDVFVWDVGAFGDFLPKMSSRDGVGAGDALSLAAGSHAHYFWGFSAPGEYEVGLSASGVHAVDGSVASDPAVYRFSVVPEPGPLSLLLAGGLLLGVRRKIHAS
jgi:surface-anchored protein